MKYKLKTGKRVHRKSHGKIGFVELARTIGKRWKLLDPESRRLLEDYHSAEKRKYLMSLNAWKGRQVVTTDFTQRAEEVDFRPHLVTDPNLVYDSLSRMTSNQRRMVSPVGELKRDQVLPQDKASTQSTVVDTSSSHTSCDMAKVTMVEDPLSFLCPSISNSVLQRAFENFDKEMEIQGERPPSWTSSRPPEHKGHLPTKDLQVPLEMFCDYRTVSQWILIWPCHLKKWTLSSKMKVSRSMVAHLSPPQSIRSY